MLPLELIDEICEYEAAYVFRGDLGKLYSLTDPEYPPPIECICGNPHQAAIWYVKHHLDSVTNRSWLCMSPDDELVRLALCEKNIPLLAGNSSELATDYCLAHMGHQGAPSLLSENINPKAISYLLAHPGDRDDQFYAIDDERIADIICADLHGLRRMLFAYYNPNERVVQFIIDQFDVGSVPYSFSKNPCQRAVDFMMKRYPSEINLMFALENTNLSMASFALTKTGGNVELVRVPGTELVADAMCKNLHQIRIGAILGSPLIFMKDAKRKKYIESI
jgi:hypothetical protein